MVICCANARFVCKIFELDGCTCILQLVMGCAAMMQFHTFVKFSTYMHTEFIALREIVQY